MTQNKTNLIWLDCEMTGLDVETDEIIEIAAIITDKDLNILAESEAIALHQPKKRLDQMDSWNTKHHNESGLVERVLASTIDYDQASQIMLDFVSPWVPKGESPMCGNSICQDRRFIAKYMPRFLDYFHYRNLDVSTLKILAQLWKPDVYKNFDKDSKHLALSDIRDSIDELKHYREHLLNLNQK